MSDTIRRLKEQYGSESPAAAEQLNSLGVVLQRHGDVRTALKYHQEALAILEWNRCNALLYDFVEKSKGHAVDMAITLRNIGNLLRERNNFVGAAEVYKECLDLFLEGLVEGGGALKRKLLEYEYKKNWDKYEDALNKFDRRAIGRILCLHPEFRLAVHDISDLFLEMQLVKFVGKNAASSRRRRKQQHAAVMEENLKSAVESLTVSTAHTPEKNNGIGHDSRRMSSHTHTTSNTEVWMKGFWEKEMGRFKRPRPISRRAITSDEEYEYYEALSSLMIPAEQALVMALNRFPLPDSVLGNDNTLRQSFTPVDVNGLGSIQECVSRDSVEGGTGLASHLLSPPSSPRCVSKQIFHQDRYQVKE